MPLATAEDAYLRLTTILAERDTKTPATLPYIELTAVYNTMSVQFFKRYPTFEPRTTLSYDLGTVTPASGFLAQPLGTTGSNATNVLAIAAQHQNGLYGGGVAGPAFSVPVAAARAGRMEVKWYFVEDTWNAANLRKYNIYINGVLYAQNVDPYALVGFGVVGSITIVVDVPLSGGLTVTATATVDNAYCTAIVCTPKDNTVALSTPIVPSGGGGGDPVPTDPTFTTVVPRWSGAITDSIGLNIHPTYFGTPDGDRYNEAIALFASYGVKHLRMNFGALNNDYVYTRIGQAGDLGLKVQAICDPTLSGDTTIRANEAVNMRDKIIAFGVQGDLSGVEGPNEWDRSMSLLYPNLRTIQQSIWNAIKGNPATSNIPVVAPSFADWRNAAKYQGVGNMITPTQMCERGNVHNYYGDSIPNDSQINTAITNTGIVAPGALIHSTETGYTNGTTNIPVGNSARSLIAAGVSIGRTILEHARTGVFERTFVYMGINEGGTSFEGNLGVFNGDLSPKPAATYLKWISQISDDPGSVFAPSQLNAFVYKITGGDANTRSEVRMKRNGLIQIWVWQQTEVQNGSNLTLLNPADVSCTLTLGGGKLANFAGLRLSTMTSLSDTEFASSSAATRSFVSSEYPVCINATLVN